jgi:cellulose synthase/poly-beta-1,6-N-acetylglucosamine synthase-like glycosyltransferase
MKISVVVPLYKTPKFFTQIEARVRADRYPDKEVVAVVDGELTAEIAAALDGLAGRVTVVNPGTHQGKAGALNQAVAGLATDVVLFLDNDVELPENPDFLTTLADEMGRFDIVDLPKEVIVASFYSEMIGFEYQSLAMASLVFSRMANRSPGVIGSAFAVKKALFDDLGGFRRVVHEDGDFGARAFRKHARYSYSLSLKVRTSMPDTFHDWMVQRKRWTLINVLWFKENFLHLLLSIFKQPRLLPTLLLIALPSVLSLLIFLGLDQLNLAVISPVVFMVGQPLQFFAGVFLWLSHNTLVSQGLASTALGFLITGAIYLVFDLVAKFRFNPLQFVVYYFVYLPVVVVLNLAMFVALLGKTRVHLDWKT